MQPETHEARYAKFIDGLSLYMERLTKPKTKSAANDNAKEMAPILAYLNGPPSEGLQTNWSLTSDGALAFDADVEETCYATENRHEVRPSPELIMKGLKGVRFREFQHALYGGGGFADRLDLAPLPGELVEFGDRVEKSAGGKVKKSKVVTRMGRWRFSDGSQTERAHKRPAKAVIATQLKMPSGAMLGTREDANQPRGGVGGNLGSKPYFEAILGVKYVYRPGGVRRKGKSYTHDESAAMLAAAIANTPQMPAITKCDPGIASGGNYHLRDLFIGMQKTTCSGGGATNWQDCIDASERRMDWFRWVASLKDEDRKVLDAAQTAKSYTDLGQSLGFTGGYARKAGKRALSAANDNLRESMKKVG